MRRTAWHVALLLLACGLWTRAEAGETLDGAIERLSKAEAACKGVKATLEMATTLNQAQLTVHVTGTIEYQIARIDGKKLVRTLARTRQKVSVPNLPAPEAEKMQETAVTHLMVMDGSFLWMEVRSTKLPQPMVVKMNLPKGPAPGALQSSVAAVGLGGLSHLALKESFEHLKQSSTLKLLPPGEVAKRKTTRIEVTLTPETVDQIPQQIRAFAPTRSIVDLDDECGAPLAVHAFSSGGQEIVRAAAKRVQVNPGLPAVAFRYMLPAGAMVRDMTEAAAPPAPTPPAPTPAPKE